MLYFSLYIAGQLLYTEGSKSYNMPEKQNQKNFRDQQILQPKTELPGEDIPYIPISADAWNATSPTARC